MSDAKMNHCALVLYVAGDLLPLSTVDSPYFKNLIEKLDPQFQIPSRKHLSTKLIDEKAAEVKDNLIKQLNKAPSVCLTIDLWSNRQMKGFMGITGHFIKDSTMKSVMTACKQFKGKHSFDNIRHEYEETMASFDICGKVTSVISDNASNMVKAFDFSIPGFSTDRKQILDDGKENCDTDSEADSDQEESSDLISEECFPKHLRCYAHSLQLVIKDGLIDCGPHLKKVITKASNIVGHVRKSIHASELLENETSLQAANATRWNSQLHMIRSVLKVSEKKLNQINLVTKLSSYERKLLNELTSILEPFEKATLLVQQQKNVSASLR